MIRDGFVRENKRSNKERSEEGSGSSVECEGGVEGGDHADRRGRAPRSRAADRQRPPAKSLDEPLRPSPHSSQLRLSAASRRSARRSRPPRPSTAERALELARRRHSEPRHHATDPLPLKLPPKPPTRGS
eukprot:scaffold26_cov159-Ochromonas_danica.AAC.15